MNTHFRNLAIVITVATVTACDPAPVEQPSAAKPEAAQPAKARTACEWVTAEQMAAVLGAPVTAEASTGTECNYTPTSGAGIPMAQLAVELGSAEAAMTATGMLGQMEPGMTNPYEGLGDQAAAIGPAIWIRRGNDLVRITVMGVEDHDAAVRRVYGIVDAAF
jgi:hypothetical protein